MTYKTVAVKKITLTFKQLHFLYHFLKQVLFFSVFLQNEFNDGRFENVNFYQ